MKVTRKISKYFEEIQPLNVLWLNFQWFSLKSVKGYNIGFNKMDTVSIHTKLQFPEEYIVNTQNFLRHTQKQINVSKGSGIKGDFSLTTPPT